MRLTAPRGARRSSRPLELDVVARVLDRLIAPSMRGWMFSSAGRGDEQPDLALADELDDPLAHRHAGPEEVLADVGQPGVRWVVGVVGDDGMPASSALLVGSLNASGRRCATAMPSALPAIAASKALTISGTSAVFEPVHCDVVPSSAEASSMPYCVGVKNGFVVTWLMNTKFHSGVSGKLPAAAGADGPRRRSRRRARRARRRRRGPAGAHSGAARPQWSFVGHVHPPCASPCRPGGAGPNDQSSDDWSSLSLKMR